MARQKVGVARSLACVNSSWLKKTYRLFIKSAPSLPPCLEGKAELLGQCRPSVSTSIFVLQLRQESGRFLFEAEQDFV